MFSTDKPIPNKEKDLLNRSSFSEQLSKAILSYNNTENLTVGLCGSWGCGKTSIINMALDYIEEMTAELFEDEKPIIIHFNPWNYSDCPQLINQFFKTIQLAINMEDGNSHLKAVGDALQNYSEVLDYLTFIPVAGKYLKPIKSLASAFGKDLSEKSNKKNNLEYQKQLVEKALLAQKQKLIVIIDDIDRLNNNQIRLIFQLVNSLAGFPNMIYLLSFDKEVVTRALEKEQECSGEDYLEKIIQIPFDVPCANKVLIHNAFAQKVSDIIFDQKLVFEDVPCDNFDKDYWYTIFNKCIKPFIENMRDVNRIINLYKFKFGMMREETNCIDLLALTALSVCAPNIYNWIYNHSHILTGSTQRAGSINGIDQKNNRTRYLEMFEEIYPKNPTVMLEVVQSLFPCFSWKTGGYNPCYDSEDDLRRNQRLACESRFELYFNLSLENVKVSKRQILYTINTCSEEELQQYFSELTENKQLAEYLDELSPHIKNMTEPRKIMFINEMIRLQTLNENNTKTGFLSVTPSYLCMQCLWELINELNEDNRNEIVLSIIKSTTEQTLPVSCEILYDIECAYGKFGAPDNYGHKFLDETKLSEAEKTMLANIKRISKTTNILYLNNNNYIFYIWNYLDRESLIEYMSNLLNDVVNIARLLLIRTRTSSRNGIKWIFNESNFSDFISKEEIYDKFVKLKNTNDFDEMSYELKEIVIAYSLWYNSEDLNHTSILKQDVEPLISKWEQK